MIAIILVELDLFHQLEHTGDDHRDAEHVEETDEYHEAGVIVRSDTCAQPDAMVVELPHTVVAIVTVSSTLRTEHAARLTVFENRHGSVTSLRAVS